jgi:hypothetical protein
MPYVVTGVFVVARLAGVIGWSWWWVFAPAWAATALVGMAGASVTGWWLVSRTVWFRRRMSLDGTWSRPLSSMPAWQGSAAADAADFGVGSEDRG